MYGVKSKYKDGVCGAWLIDPNNTDEIYGFIQEHDYYYKDCNDYTLYIDFFDTLSEAQIYLNDLMEIVEKTSEYIDL